jgi:hypothetical protein
MLEIQYNRNEEYKTIVTQTSIIESITNNTITSTSTTNATTTNDESSSSSSSTPILLNSNFNVKLSLNNDNDIETTIIFMPNVWNLMPNSIEYQQYVDLYKNLIENPDISPSISSRGSVGASASAAGGVNESKSSNGMNKSIGNDSKALFFFF